jgi:5-methylcytosine-specific restriction endonuclease McrA
MIHCVLLNADYSVLNLVDWKRAMCLVAKDKVMVLAYSETSINCSQGIKFKVPAVMKLMKLVKTIYRIKIPYSKNNVIIRDGFCCAYCGMSQKFPTLDHVVPKSRNGATNFENCVTCCRDCNHKKGDRTPKEAAMPLKITPWHPTISEFLRIKAKQLGVLESLARLGLY